MAQDSGAPPSAVTLERCLAWWRAFDVHARVGWLSAASGEVAERVELAKQARLQLTEGYKGWKKIEDDGERLARVVDLIKQFQQSDDQLQKRAKTAELTVLTLHKDLLDAPDPAVHLERAVELARAHVAHQDANARLQAEVASLRTQLAHATGLAVDADELAALRRENGELEAELMTLTNQDTTIRSLAQRLAEVEESMDAQVAATLESREGELRAAFEAELEDVRESEAASETRVSALTSALQDAQRARDEAAASVYQVRARAEEEVAAARAEADGASGEVDRLTRSLSLKTAAMEEWKRKAAEAGADGARGRDGALLSPTAKAAHMDALRARAEAAEDEASRLASTVSALQEENRRWSGLLDSQRGGQDKLLADARASVAAREAEVASLRAELNGRPTLGSVADLRRQVALLQAVQFGGGEEDAEGVEGEGAGGASGGAPPATDIHGVMLRRIRQLENRAVRAEGARAEAVNAAEALRADLSACTEQLEEQRGLARQLDALLSGRLGVGRGGEAPPSPLDPSSPSKGGVSSDAGGDALITILTSPGGAATTTGGPDGEASSALVAVLRGQRDKFRARVLELEAELQVKQGRVAEASDRLGKLHSDNLRLYEKVRYLTSALEGSGGGRGGGDETRVAVGMRARPPPGRGGSGDGSGGGEEEAFEAEYAKSYREGLLESMQAAGDPVADFRKRERAATFARLSAGEKLTVTGSRLFLANKVLRRVVLLYAGCLHLLVFATMLHFVNTTHGDGHGGGCGGAGGAGLYGSDVSVDAALGRPELGARGRLP